MSKNCKSTESLRKCFIDKASRASGLEYNFKTKDRDDSAVRGMALGYACAALEKALKCASDVGDLIHAVKNFLEFHALDKHEQGPIALAVNIKFARETLKKAGVEE